MSDGAGYQLTPRERAVAELIARGHGNRQIADQLVLTVKSVERYARAIRDKLGVRTRGVLIARLATDIRGGCS